MSSKLNDHSYIKHKIKHDDDMKTMVNRLKAMHVLAASVIQVANRKGLEYVEDHILCAQEEITAAYGLINDKYKINVEGD